MDASTKHHQTVSFDNLYQYKHCIKLQRFLSSIIYNNCSSSLSMKKYFFKWSSTKSSLSSPLIIKPLHRMLIIIIIINTFISTISSLTNVTTNVRRLGRLPPQRFEMEPIDKTSIVGDTIILPCRVANKVGTLQWTRDGFGLGTERTLEGFQRYRMIGSDDEGDYSLEISPVQLEDDAIFQCQVGAVDGVIGIRSRSARFTVQVPPEPPVIVVTHAHSHAQVYRSSNDDNDDDSLTVSSPASASSIESSDQKSKNHNLRTTAGMTIELTCEAHGGRPPAELTWMDNAGNPITNGITYSTTKLPDGKRWNAAIKWTVVANRQLDGQRITCRSENAALKSPRYASIQLEVRYPPEVELRIVTSIGNGDDDGIVREGDDLTLECLAIGNPSLMTFKWSRDGQPINNHNDDDVNTNTAASGDGSPRLIFRHIGREFHGTVIACEVANSVGTTRARLEVKVAFRPRFTRLPETVIGLTKNEHVRLNCSIDSYPVAKIYWQRYHPKLMISNNNNNNNNNNWQTIGDGQSIQIADAGRYRCVAKNAAFDDQLKAETLVFIKGAPLIRSPSIQYGVENEPIRLQCIVEAVPPPTKITWFKLKPYQQLLGVDNNEGYEILEEEDPDDYSMFIQSSSASASSSSSSGAAAAAAVSSPSYLISNNNENKEEENPDENDDDDDDDDDDGQLSSLSLLRSIIYMRRAKFSDFGQYNCSVWNQYGFQSQIITLERQNNILSPLILTLSGIICFAVIFVLITSLLIFICLRSQRLSTNFSTNLSNHHQFNNNQTLTTKKLDSTTDSATVTRSILNGSINAINDCNGMYNINNNNNNNDNKNIVMMKNTIMKMNGSNQIMTTLTNGQCHQNLLQCYNSNNNDKNFQQLNHLNNHNNNHNLNNHNHYLSTSLNDYCIDNGNDKDDTIIIDCNTNGLPSTTTETKISLNHNYNPNQELNHHHLYSTVKKNNGSIQQNNNVRLTKIGDQFINPYVRTSSSSSSLININGLPTTLNHHHYSNVDNTIIIDNDESRLLSAGVYHTSSSSSSTTNHNHNHNHNHHINNTINNRYKTNSIGGNSSSSGVISNGGSCSPGGHSPVGSITIAATTTTINCNNNNNNGTHV